MAAFLQFWSERAPRERAALAAGIAFLAVALLYALAFDPAWSGIVKLQRNLPEARRQDGLLHRLIEDAKELRRRPAVAKLKPNEARTELERRMGAAGLKADKIAPGADGSLQMKLSGVDFAAFASWIANIEGDLGARVLLAHIVALPTPGQVDVDLTLTFNPR